VTYKFDSNSLGVEQVGSLENDTKRPFTNLLSDPIMYTDDIARG
jgi:hypothetical protein